MGYPLERKPRKDSQYETFTHTIRGSEGAFSERPKPDKVGAPPKPPRVGAPPKPPRVGYYPDYILRLMRFGIMDSHSHPKTNGELFDKISSIFSPKIAAFIREWDPQWVLSQFDN